MEVEDEYKLLQRLFFKKYGRALPEKKSDDVDIEMDPKDLTEEQKKMEAIPSLAPVDFVKKKSIKIDDTVKTVVNQVEEIDKVACFSLRQAPSEGKSDFNGMSSKQTSLLRIDIKSPSVDASQDETKRKREDDTPSIQVPLPVVRKTKPIEIVAIRKSLRKSDVIPEKEDDKGRKDVADHTAKQFKLTSAGASSMPVGLTPRPDPNRTQQGPYNQAGPQFMGQHFGQPPPMFPNPPPTPPNLPTFQQHQAAARYLEKLPLTVNYNGIPKLKVPIFDGKLSEYQKFKLTFNTAYDNGRNLPKQHLVSLLQMSLQGKPLKFVSDFTKMSIDDSMYACMWQLLDDKYGDRNTEDEFTVGLFKDTLPIKNGSLTEVERIYEIFSIQHAYYLTKDPASLTMNKSLLFQWGKEKLNDEFFVKFFCFAEKYNLILNFTALITFMQAEFLFAQKEEREQTLLSHKSDINLC